MFDFADSQNIYQVYNEAINLFSKQPLIDAINNILDNKQVTNPQIRKWILTRELQSLIEMEPEVAADWGFITPHQHTHNDPSWAVNTYDITSNSMRSTYGPNGHKTDIINHKIDFLNSRDAAYIRGLSHKTIEDVNGDMIAWDEELANRPAEFKLVEGEDYKVLRAWGDGFKMVQLITPAACKYEGGSMGHCAGGYSPEKLISLWDSKNEPHATLEVYEEYGTLYIKQIKGKQNKAPIPKYVPYIVDFLKSVDAVVQHDGDNIGMVRYGDNVEGGVYKERFYFEDSENWQNIYKNKILPRQKAVFDHIMSMVNGNLIEGSIDLKGLYLTKLPDLSSYTCTGDFECSDNRITDFTGAPSIVKGWFTGFKLYNLKSLKGSPKEVGRYDITLYNGVNDFNNLPKHANIIEIANSKATEAEIRKYSDVDTVRISERNTDNLFI